MRSERSVSSPLVLALDGHDGSGKTTLALRLAARLGTVAVRPYAGDTGVDFLAAAEGGEFDRASALARAAVRSELERHAGEPVLVFDRHWVTVLSILPDRYLPAWEPLPPTAVCWADLATTLERVDARPEVTEPRAWHARYVRRYRALADRFGCPLIRTDTLSEDEALDELTRWAESVGAAAADAV